MDICAVSGYEEVGRNMTAVKVDDDVIILDMGVHLEQYIKYTEDEDIAKVSAQELINAKAIPNDAVIKEWASKVRAIIPTHAHLDHVGAIPYLASKYNAPILCTPFTAEVIKAITNDEGIKLSNKIEVMNPNSIYTISKDLKVEFVSITHSVPQTVMVALHTKEGIVIYANDFKFDNHPVLGDKPNYSHLESLGKKGVLALIVDSTKSGDPIKTPSEKVAKEMLKDVMLGTDSRGNAVVVTTFSSHIARLKTIIEVGQKLNREIVFLGRSLDRYVTAAENVGLVNFTKQVEMVKYGQDVRKKLKKIEQNPSKYLMVVTGHQGEPQAALAKMIDGSYRFRPGDHVIFSCTVIPTETNINNRRHIESCLEQKGVRIFRDIHVSGHAAKEDLRDFINFLKPRHIFPAHCEPCMADSMMVLAKQMGYQSVHKLKDGQFYQLRKT